MAQNSLINFFVCFTFGVAPCVNRTKDQATLIRAGCKQSVLTQCQHNRSDFKLFFSTVWTAACYRCKQSDKITYAVVRWSKRWWDPGPDTVYRLLKDNGVVLARQSLAMVLGDGSDILSAAVATGSSASLQQAIIKFGKYVNR